MKPLALVCFAFLSFGIIPAFSSESYVELDPKIPRFSQVTENIFRGGRPQNDADYQKLKALGIRTVISLETKPGDISADKAKAEKYGLKFVSTPVDVGAQEPSEESINGAFEALKNSEDYPVFIHCMHGRDRTGLLIALYRAYVQGWATNKAWKEMKSFGYKDEEWCHGITTYFWSHMP